VLGIKSNIVRGLVTQGLLGIAAGYRNGFAKLIPEKEVHRFTENLCVNIGARQTIRAQQWLSGSPPEGVGHTVACHSEP
jgi:hypothetical protein